MLYKLRFKLADFILGGKLRSNLFVINNKTSIIKDCLELIKYGQDVNKICDYSISCCDIIEKETNGIRGDINEKS